MLVRCSRTSEGCPLIGLIVGLARGWQLALVLMGLVPVIGSVMGLTITTIAQFTSKEAGP